MHKLLLIDDEPLIVDSLFQLMSLWEGAELEVWKAYSAEEGMEIMQSRRIDILVTDVRMPGMSGLELVELVRKQWRQCKVVFLSGYSDYEYLQTAMRHHAFDYLLKPVDDETMLDAILRVLEEIESEGRERRALERAEMQLHKAQHLLVNEFLGDLLGGRRMASETIGHQLQALQIPLRHDRPMIMMLGRVDRWPQGYTVRDKYGLQYAIGNIVEEYLDSACSVVSYISDRYIAWMLQPTAAGGEAESGGPNQLHWYVNELLDKIQYSIQQVLKLPCSFIVSGSDVELIDAHQAYSAMFELLQRGIGLDEEIILVDKADETLARYERQDLSSHDLKRSVQQLNNLLEVGERETFRQELNRFFDSVQKTVFLDISMQAEIFVHLSSMFLSYINTRKIAQSLGGRLQLDDLTNISKHTGWDAWKRYFGELAELLFSIEEGERKDQKKEIIEKADAYLLQSLHRNVSLTELAKHVHLSPYYLSRLYHAEKGYSISERIKNLKVTGAKELLVQDGLRILDVAMRLGFENVPYFTKFFKKHVGITPQDYKQSNKV